MVNCNEHSKTMCAQAESSATSTKPGLSSKSALSAKEVKEYLEDMELKIRYMKNDIEFKQSQILNKKSLPARTVVGHSTTQPAQPPAHRKQVLSSAFTSASQHSKGQNYLSGSTSRFTYVKKPSVINAGVERTLSTSLSVQSGTGNNSKPSLAQKPAFSQPVSSQCFTVPSLPTNHSYAQSHPVPSETQTQSSKASIVKRASNPETLEKVAATVFDRLGGFASCSPTKPIYVSPSKNQAVWSHSPSRTVVSQAWNKRQAQISTALAIDHIKIEEPQPARQAQISTALVTEHHKTREPQPATAISQSASRGVGPAMSMSRYKLVKTNTGSGPKPASRADPQSGLVSSQAVQNPVSALSSTVPSVVPTKSPTRKTPKLKIPGKLVSKYKMMRLSPSSMPKVAPQLFRGPATAVVHLRPRSQNTNIHKLDRRLAGPSTQSNFVSKSPQQKPPGLSLKVATAAKLVSKYKLKRLSPTTAPKEAPSLNREQSTSVTSHFSPRSPHLGGKIVRSRHKLDRRPTNTSGLNNANNSNNFGPNSFIKRVTPHKFSSPHRRQDLRETPLNRNSQASDWRRKRLLGRVSTSRHNSPFSKVKNVHKLDRRQPKGLALAAAAKLRGKAVLRQRSRHLWSNKFQNLPSSPLGTPHFRKRQLSGSKYKWRRLSLKSPIYGSQFKWSPFTRPSASKGRSPWSYFKEQRHSSLIGKSNLVMIRGKVYRTNTWQQASKRATPVDKGFKSQSNMKLITVRGTHRFHTDATGKKLCRTGLAPAASSQSDSGTDRKRFRWHRKPVDETAILAASRVVHRSIAVAAAAKFRKNSTKWRRRQKQQHCIFFGRFGRCHRGDACKYAHDSEKVAVCTRFLRGKCDQANCPFSHNASVHKMPVCLHFLQGLCSREGCPYLHVRLNPDAPVCKDFYNGYCSLGDKCKKLHSVVCPSFAVTGECSRGEDCSLLHRKIKRESEKSATPVRSRSQKRRRSSGLEQPKVFPTNQSLEDHDAQLDIPNPQQRQDSQSQQSVPQGTLSSETPPLTEGSASEGQPECEAESSASKTDTLSDLPTAPFQRLTSSPSKGSAPLASQPSFISLPNDSPCNPLPRAPSVHTTSRVSVPSSIKLSFVAHRLTGTSTVSAGFSQPSTSTSIRPFFVSQRLGQAESSTPDKSHPSQRTEPGCSLACLTRSLPSQCTEPGCSLASLTRSLPSQRTEPDCSLASLTRSHPFQRTEPDCSLASLTRSHPSQRTEPGEVTSLTLLSKEVHATGVKTAPRPAFLLNRLLKPSPEQE